MRVNEHVIFHLIFWHQCSGPVQLAFFFFNKRLWYTNPWKTKDQCLEVLRNLMHSDKENHEPTLQGGLLVLKFHLFFLFSGITIASRSMGWRLSTSRGSGWKRIVFFFKTQVHSFIVESLQAQWIRWIWYLLRASSVISSSRNKSISSIWTTFSHKVLSLQRYICSVDTFDIFCSSELFNVLRCLEGLCHLGLSFSWAQRFYWQE